MRPEEGEEEAVETEGARKVERGSNEEGRRVRGSVPATGIGGARKTGREGGGTEEPAAARRASRGLPFIRCTQKNKGDEKKREKKKDSSN